MHLVGGGNIKEVLMDTGIVSIGGGGVEVNMIYDFVIVCLPRHVLF